MEKAAVLKTLQTIPGIGKAGSEDLWNLGIRRVTDLRGQDPQTLYDKHCLQQGKQVDRCVLYVFRCAVYYASNDTHDPELLKWWNWKDSD
jgi:hypothetical protein